MAGIRFLKFLACVLMSGMIFLMGACQIGVPTDLAAVDQTPSLTSSLTVTPDPSATPTITATSTATPTVTLTPTPQNTATPVIPVENYIKGVTSHRQYFPLGCETRVAVDWALYYGVQITEYDFQFKLPLSDNPDKGFVGGVMGPWGQIPPYSYGVHAAPVAATLREYGLNAVGIKGMTLEQLKRQIAANQPVIAWVIGNCVGGVPHEFTDRVGDKAIVAAYEHVVIVIGYNAEKIRYLNNGQMYETPIKVFLNSWGVLGNMALTIGD